MTPCGHLRHTDGCPACAYWRDRHAARLAGREVPPPGLGDEVEALVKTFGLDRLAKAYEKVTGKPCGCNRRKAMMNKLPAVLPQVRRLLGG